MLGVTCPPPISDLGVQDLEMLLIGEASKREHAETCELEVSSVSSGVRHSAGNSRMWIVREIFL